MAEGFILVVAAAVHDVEGRILLAQRPHGKHHGGLWEFPGGKVESGETPQGALCREIAEELGITLSPGALVPAGFAQDGGNGARPGIVLLLYICRCWAGNPVGLEEQEWGWFTREQAVNLDLAPMDRALLQQMSDNPVAKPDSPA